MIEHGLSLAFWAACRFHSFATSFAAPELFFCHRHHLSLQIVFLKTKNPSFNKKSRECRFALLISQIALQDLAPCPCARALVGCWDVIGPVPRSLLIKKLFNFQIYYVIPLRKIQLIANPYIWFFNYICSTHFLSILKKDQVIPRCWSFLLSDQQDWNSRINYSQYT